MNDEDVLGAFREDPLPPSGVDVARAVRTGRRQRRMRTAGAAGALALLLVGGAAVPAWLTGGAGSAQVGSTLEATLGPLPPPCPSPSPTAAPSVPADGSAPASFDVLRHWVDVTEVTRPQADTDADLHVEDFTTARFWQRVSLLDRAERFRVEVAVFAGGGKPMFGAPGDFPGVVDADEGEPAGRVGGRPAWWLPGRQGMYQYDAARLAWQWADGGWAFVSAADTAQQPDRQPSAEAMAVLRATAQRVAAALTIGRGTAVTTPFTVPGVPKCSRLTRTTVYRGTKVDGTPFSRVAVTFGRVDNTDPLRFPPDVTTTVDADSGSTPADKPGSADEQVDGHPAVINEGFLVLHDVDGFALEITAQLPRDALIAYARSVRIVEGAHGDESKWTDRPIRP